MFKVIKTITVRRDFEAGPKIGSVVLRRNCGLGCTCGATIYKTDGPTPRLAAERSLCFNDKTGEGISEIQGSAKRVDSQDGVTAYEVQAHIKKYIDSNESGEQAVL